MTKKRNINCLLKWGEMLWSKTIILARFVLQFVPLNDHFGLEMVILKLKITNNFANIPVGHDHRTSSKASLTEPSNQTNCSI